jgi:hypothetical protein
MPRSARNVTWYLGNQEITVGAVSVMLLAALIALGQSIQIRRLKHQMAAVRAEYARREAAPVAQRG